VLENTLFLATYLVHPMPTGIDGGRKIPLNTSA